MGLFSSVMHVRHAAPSELAAGLDSVMAGFGHVRSAATPVSEQGPEPPVGEDIASYACGPLRGEWCTVVVLHFDEAAKVAEILSEVLDTHVLWLNLHDGDVFYSYLYRGGELLDAYDSEPMYFEEQRISEDEVERRRHHPEALVPLLPPGALSETLKALLDRGWWRAHDRGGLDEDGVVTEEMSDAGEEMDAEERMAAFATLLRLHGSSTDYPYVAWFYARGDAWSGFTQVAYVRAPDA